MNAKWVLAKAAYDKHKRYVPMAAFIAGLSLDAFSLNRFDHWFTLTQHGIYLGLIALLFCLEFLNAYHKLTFTGFGAYGQRVSGSFWNHQEEMIHFLFGSLLSANTVFYFKSGSFLTSFFFMAAIMGCLFANEVERFRRLGLMMRSGLLCLCIATYLIYVMPIIFGGIGVTPFLVSMLCTAILMLLLWGVIGYRFELRDIAQKVVLVPAACVIIGLIGFYFLKLIPPVPLSLKSIGIYHNVERIADGYQVTHSNPWWRFWQHGDQSFVSHPGDRVYCFFNVLSPGGFRDQLQVRWLFLDSHNSWHNSDAIPVQVHGGREEGYRGFTYKQNFHPGYWQVRIETSDSREIGRIYLSIKDHGEGDGSPKVRTEIL